MDKLCCSFCGKKLVKAGEDKLHIIYKCTDHKYEYRVRKGKDK